jgi:DNA polymerase-1
MLMKNLIFDGHNTFLRNYAVNPAMDNNGNAIGGIIGTIRSVKSMIAETKADRVYFVWDGPGGSKKRRGIFAEYKAGRKVRLNREFEAGDVKENANNMHEQMERVKPLLRFLGVTQIEIDDIEADDAIAYLVGCLEHSQSVLVSSDKDMWQLVSDDLSIYWPVKKVYITGKTMEADGCLPGNWIYVKALLGDNSDNIDGVKGIGPVTIKKLFPEFSQRTFSLAEFFQLVEDRAKEHNKARTILEAKELVRRNVDLMQLSSPVISSTSASVIRNALDVKPVFNFTGFKLAMLNQGIQLTDSDLISTFRMYQMRSEHVA